MWMISSDSLTRPAIKVGRGGGLRAGFHHTGFWFLRSDPSFECLAPLFYDCKPGPFRKTQYAVIRKSIPKPCELSTALGAL